MGTHTTKKNDKNLRPSITWFSISFHQPTQNHTLVYPPSVTPTKKFVSVWTLIVFSNSATAEYKEENEHRPQCHGLKRCYELPNDVVYDRKAYCWQSQKLIELPVGVNSIAWVRSEPVRPSENPRLYCWRCKPPSHFDT